MKIRALLFAAAFLVACKAAETPEQMATREAAEADSAKAAIMASNAAWVAATNAGQAESLLTLFTPDGVMMPPDVPGATGRDSILARYRMLMAPGGVLTITSRAISVHGPMATDRGVWTYVAPAQGRNPAINMAGKYLTHFHKTADGWRIAEDIWNNDMPAPPQPAARR